MQSISNLTLLVFRPNPNTRFPKKRVFKPEYQKQNIELLSVSSSHPSILLEKRGHLKITLSAYLFVKTQTSMLKMTYFYLLNMLKKKKKAQKVFIGLMQINIYIVFQIYHIPRFSCQNI